MSDRARWAVLGAGVITGDFVAALPQAEHGVLHAVGARDGMRARAFADAHGAPVAGTYDEVLARGDVDAVYIGTVHTTHAELANAALAAGKAVLCEKPLGVTVSETEDVLAHAGGVGLPVVEAFKYRFGPFADRLRALISAGVLGELISVDSTLGFAASVHEGRLFDPEIAGGAILDVGCYPASLVVGLAAWAGIDAEPVVVEVDGVVGAVDEQARARIAFGAFEARIATAITADLPRTAVIRGTAGVLEIANVWGSRIVSTADAVLRRPDGSVEHIRTPTVSPMAAEADATILALRDGRTEAPEMPWLHTRTTARLLADWRAALG
ncbi:Gfo/Idh/MocA family oxidoreductase [Microbacterium sp. VKM Ac-2870]|uniref:Gfo/Idh/MocA family protein n=1 Tax=Microbacterium sp. VKM Ac-2870 TaxID=2783825 RepID=UPI00188BE4C4|nr:Gfo/Idh/MocA family oxidoreductase [Microbacterium sp. VKM Ac-2870]MBF4562107.1 Gfo/Idh/MocA family oxidoreductase [Microbacterium sp. VKM Ac-2870]